MLGYRKLRTTGKKVKETGAVTKGYREEWVINTHEVK